MCVIPNDCLRLASLEKFSSPFDYFVSSQAFSPNFSYVVLDWLETSAPWNLVVSDFYEQYEFSFWNVDLPSYLSVLIEEDFVTRLRASVGNIFKAKLSMKVDIAAHKLVQGQRIRLHNDFIWGQETHRLLIHLNRAWKEEDGGLLVFFNSSDPDDIHKAFRPVHNTALAFAVSPKSNHAVSVVHGGQRFTLVYSFYSE
jgi:hypothetical protein